MTDTQKATFSGFQEFLSGVVQIPETALPSDSPVIQYAYDAAIALVLRQLRCVAPGLYVLAVYNLATSFLLQFAPDQPGSDFFAQYRKSHNIGVFNPGVISSSSDSSTSQSWLSMDWMKNLSMSDLQHLKDPYGLAYLQIMQSWGNIWGIT